MEDSFGKEDHDLVATTWQEKIQKLKEQNYYQINELQEQLEEQKKESDYRERTFTLQIMQLNQHLTHVQHDF